jgi:hypothetical protein
VLASAFAIDDLHAGDGINKSEFSDHSPSIHYPNAQPCGKMRGAPSPCCAESGIEGEADEKKICRSGRLAGFDILAGGLLLFPRRRPVLRLRLPRRADDAHRSASSKRHAAISGPQLAALARAKAG